MEDQLERDIDRIDDSITRTKTGENGRQIGEQLFSSIGPSCIAAGCYDASPPGSFPDASHVKPNKSYAEYRFNVVRDVWTPCDDSAYALGRPRLCFEMDNTAC